MPLSARTPGRQMVPASRLLRFHVANAFEATRWPDRARRDPLRPRRVRANWEALAHTRPASDHRIVAHTCIDGRSTPQRGVLAEAVDEAPLEIPDDQPGAHAQSNRYTYAITQPRFAVGRWLPR